LGGHRFGVARSGIGFHGGWSDALGLFDCFALLACMIPKSALGGKKQPPI
jgi:hypothetical protein